MVLKTNNEVTHFHRHFERSEGLRSLAGSVDACADVFPQCCSIDCMLYKPPGLNIVADKALTTEAQPFKTAIYEPKHIMFIPTITRYKCCVFDAGSHEYVYFLLRPVQAE